MKNGVKRRIAKYFHIIAAISIFCVSVLAIIQARKILINETVQSFDKISEELYYNANRVILKGIDDTKIIAGNSIISSSGQNDDAKKKELIKMKQFFKIYDDISLISPNGNVIASTDYNFRGAWQYKENFKKALKGETTRSTVHFIPDPLKLIISFFSPVYNENKELTAIMSVQLNMDDVSDIIKHVRIGATGHAFLLDRFNNYIVYPDEQLLMTKPDAAIIKQMSDNSQAIVFKDKFGDKYIGSYFPHDHDESLDVDSGWTVAVVQSESEIFQSLNPLIFQIIVFSFIIFALTIMFVTRFAVTLTKPITTLSNGALRIGKGELDFRISVDSEDELKELASSFNNMAEELQRSQTRLEKAESNLRNIFHSIPSALIAVTPDGVITQWNASAEKFLGVSYNNAVSRKLSTVTDLFKDSGEILERAFATGLPEELKINSGRKIFYITISPLIFENVTGAVIRIDDVTEIEKKEGQLRQAQKMETVGNLAGGLAHDFNNVLGGIIGTVSLIKYYLNNDKADIEEIKKDITMIEDSSKRAADMVQQLLTLASKQETAFAPVDINLSVKHVLRICNNTLDKSVAINTSLYNLPAMVEADPTQIEQVILNLCLNASHAMTVMRSKDAAHGGLLSIIVSRIMADRNFFMAHPEAVKTNYWAVSISDTGVGIEPGSLPKIFDPFFTTKKRSGGTGLGLSMAYNIVKHHKGFMEVTSEVGKGSTFKMFLPELEVKAPEQAVKTGDRIDSLPKGSGKILMIDDEEMVRNIAKEMLETCGYDVVLAENGKNGLIAFMKNVTDLKAVILDLSMPVMSGREVFLEIKKIKPDTKVILTSGSNFDERVAEIMELGFTSFIHKPYTIFELARKISEL